MMARRQILKRYEHFKYIQVMLQVCFIKPSRKSSSDLRVTWGLITSVIPPKSKKWDNFTLDA